MGEGVDITASFNLDLNADDKDVWNLQITLNSEQSAKTWLVKCKN